MESSNFARGLAAYSRNAGLRGVALAIPASLPPRFPNQ